MIQRDPSTMDNAPSFVLDSSEQVNVVYHPPVDLEKRDCSEEIQANRYRAALESSFTPRGVRDFTRNMDNRIVQIMSSETNATESTLGNISSYTTSDTQGMASTNTYETTDASTNYDSDMQSPRNQRGMMSVGLSSDASQNYLLADDLQEQAEDDYFRVKQSFGYCSIAISAIQLLVLMMQLALCGVAPLDVNPMVGPYPDAFSEWGGKNAYFLISELQLFRLVTPAILHVGILHLLLNAFVQLETCAFFEREWGSFRWLVLYVMSEIGCIGVSCVVNPDTIAVGSSGAVMGLFGAKFAQLLTYNNFELVGTKDPSIRLEQLSGIMCSLSVIAILSFINYIDWSGHAGGFGTGFCCGIVAFAGPIRSSVNRFLWILLGLAMTGVGFYFTFDTLFTKITPDSDMADACTYFRNLYTENDECECAWG